MASGEHDCEWKERSEQLEGEVTTLKSDVATLKHELETLMRRLLGPKSEKMPPVEKQLRTEKPKDKAATQRRRRERAEARRQKVQQVTVVHPVMADKAHCPECGNKELKRVGEGKESVVYKFVPAHFVAERHLRETLACSCGGYIVTADGPTKWADKSHYAPSFVAQLVTAKCADHEPLYRQAKAFARIGVPVSRSTLGDLFHRAAATLAPIAIQLSKLVRASPVVRADETSKRVLDEGHCRNGFMWNFNTVTPDDERVIVYVFAPDRSGKTPQKMLGGTKGHLMADAFTGYNRVTAVGGRTRAACWAHARRYFFDALKASPEDAQKAMDFILALYRVEHELEADRLLGTEEHLARRKKRSGPVLKSFKKWLNARQPKHAPKTPLGRAIRYTLKQWTPLRRFLDDVRVPLDNNASEAALRRVALGRKNFLFVGNDESGEHLATLYTVVATCEANGVNPVEYLTDVLGRINEHPASKLDELLPHKWRGPPDAARAAG
jgi:transposase